MRLEDLLEEIENDDLEKTASEDKEVDGIADEVYKRALEKVAKAKAEKDPEEMLEESEDEEIEEIEEEIEEELQHEKVASLAGGLDSDSKKKLFEKVASYALAANPRIVKDNNFQHFEDFSGVPKAIEQFFNVPGEEVNHIY